MSGPSDTVLRTIRFGVFELDLHVCRRVAQGRHPSQRAGSALHTPRVLLERPADTFVDFDQGLNAALQRNAAAPRLSVRDIR